MKDGKQVLAYSRKADELHQEFLDAIFHTEPPMSAAEQREAFQTALSEALEVSCSLEVVQAVHEQLTDRIEQHRESKGPEPPVHNSKRGGGILADCSAAEKQVAAFCKSCTRRFGAGAALRPANPIDSSFFEIKTQTATVSVEPERSYMVETRVIDGKKYHLIPVGEGLEVNGMPVE